MGTQQASVYFPSHCGFAEVGGKPFKAGPKGLGSIHQTAGSTAQDPEPSPRLTDGQMFLRQLIALLSLLSGAHLPTGFGRPGPQGPPSRLWAATNETRALGRGVPASQVQSSALSSWRAFLGLQKTGRLGRGSLQQGQEAAPTMSLPLDPHEVTRERCEAVPFTQVRVAGGEEGRVSALAESTRRWSCTDLGSGLAPST